MFLYPVLICFFYSVVFRFVYFIGPPLAALPTAVSICQTLLSAENDISFYFSTLVTTLLILGITSLAFRWRITRARVAESGLL